MNWILKAISALADIQRDKYLNSPEQHQSNRKKKPNKPFGEYLREEDEKWKCQKNDTSLNPTQR